MNLKLKNIDGDILVLDSNPNFFLTNVAGQTSAISDISSIVIGGIDGDSATNVQAQPRTIVLDLIIKQGVNVEDAKRAILKVVKLKQKCTLIWTQNYRVVSIDGIVESVDMPRWNSKVMMQITLHCEQPFWEDFESQIISINEAISLHYFTQYSNDQLIFTSAGQPMGMIDASRTRRITNGGDTDVGMDIEIIALDTVTNPIITDDTGAFFGVGYGTGAKQVVMAAGDIIKISTHKGAKSVKLNGTSVLTKLKPNSTWLQLVAGRNTLSVSSNEASSDNVTFNLIYKQRYV